MQPRENNDPRTQQSGLIYEGAVEEYGKHSRQSSREAYFHFLQ